MVIFEPKDFQAAKRHRYPSSENPSLVSKIFAKIWPRFIKIFPIWLDPKLILIPSVILQFFTFLLTCVSSNFMLGAVDSLTCYISSFCTILYVFLKGASGRQAQYADVFPALQIYFEKACDHIVIPMEALKCMMIIRMGKTGRTVYGMGYVGIIQFAASLEEYCTKHLNIQRMFGADEVLIGAAMIELSVGIDPKLAHTYSGEMYPLVFLFGFLFILFRFIVKVFKANLHDPSRVLSCLSSIIQCILTFAVFTINEALTYDAYLTIPNILLFTLMLSYLAKLETLFTITENIRSVYFYVCLVEELLLIIPMFPSYRNDTGFFHYLFITHIAIIIVTDWRAIFGLSEGIDIPVFSPRRKKMAISSSADLKAYDTLPDVSLH